MCLSGCNLDKYFVCWYKILFIVKFLTALNKYIYLVVSKSVVNEISTFKNTIIFDEI